MNYIMSLGLERPIRSLTRSYFSNQKPLSIADIGAGPGSSIRSFYETTGYIVAIDPSAELLSAACIGCTYMCDRVVGIAEHTPIRDQGVDYSTAFFSARDFIDVSKGVEEAARIARRGVIITDIFIPENILLHIMLLYWVCAIVPLLALFFAPRHWKEYRRLCTTLRSWITSSQLKEELRQRGLKVSSISFFDTVLEMVIGKK